MAMAGEKVCCKCQMHKWPDPQEVVWVNPDDGDGYCLYHAPKEHKGVDEKTFNNRVLERIDNYKAHANDCASSKCCNFTSTIFPADISFWAFDSDNPLPNICLDRAIFHGSATFSNVSFCNATFIGTNFQDGLFDSAQFHGKATFSSAIFNGGAYFDEAKFHGGAQFNRTTFIKDATYSFALFESYSSFRGTIFSRAALFNVVTYNGDLRFFNAIFKSKADFRNSTIMKGNVHLTNLEASCLKHVTISLSDLPLFTLNDCRWAERFGLDIHGNGDADNLLACEELYRAMKQRAAEKHDQPMVSRWHFREKLMQLKQLFDNERSNNLLEEVEDRDAKWLDRAKAWFKLLWHRPHWQKLTLTGLYWATSGFGERAVRAGVWLVALVALSFALNATPQPMDWNSMWGATAVNATLATIPFAKDIPGDGWVKVGRGVWQFLIALQFTLFALAVRNRFRR